ncbi:hypothetical protein [Arcobacter sp. LA11]|uniref:hypothetical protein n=1 Tax=Arcobacter sp. LA11 TaxID=1898176 RepID=UPI0009337D77|nr:hypothetical protein [Arcobacter sp. LA11]
MKSFLITLVFTIAAFAHTPIMSCIDEGDGTVTCEGGFSDGSSAGGVKFRVVSNEKKILLDTKLNSESEVNFKKPEVDYSAVFDAGPQHEVYIKSKDILE